MGVVLVASDMLASVRLEEKSLTACALTSWRDRVHLAWVDTDRRLNLMSSVDGRRFAAPYRFAHRTFSYDNSSSSDSFSDMVFTAPALCGHRGRLVLAWLGTDRHLNVADVPVT